MTSLSPDAVLANGTDAGPKAAASAAPTVSKKLLKCQKVATKYQRKFRAVEALRSQDLHRLFLSSGSRNTSSTENDNDVGAQGQETPIVGNGSSNAPIFVDVRTAAERAVSVIEGSVTLAEFHADQADDRVHARLLQESPVIVYCTIGYRSGLEATRLHQLYPGLRIGNLDGVCLYAHAAARDQELPRLIDPETGAPAARIHTFGRQWDFVNGSGDRYDGVHFGPAETVLRMVPVGWRAAVRHAQTAVHHLNCCGGAREKHLRRVH